MLNSTARIAAVVAGLFSIATTVVPHAGRAQGLSGSEVSGTVRLADGRPADNAVVVLVDRNSGAQRSSRTRAGGAYRFDNVDVGSYRIEARAIGSAAASTNSLELHLGDRLRLDIVLGAQVTVLDDATITARMLRDAGAGGPAVTVAGRAARNIPLINRDVTGLFLLTSHALGSQGLWISGQHSRYNAIQIDGAAANDFFGVSVTPGSASGGRLISPEVIEEARILIAPFDVRMGGFAGGLVNAVTRSGSNQRVASVFASLTRSELQGEDTSGAHAAEFNQIQYGAAGGGPLIKDRLHYFFGVELQQRAAKSIGLSAGDPATGISEATAFRIQNALRSKYGFDPGGAEAPDLGSPSANVFLKLSWHPRPNFSVDLTPSYATSRKDTLIRSINSLDGWQLSRSGSETFSKSSGAVMKANFTIGAVSSETIAGYNGNSFGVRSRSRAPEYLVQADLPGIYAAGGSTRGAQGTATFTGVAQLAHNSSIHVGDHTLVVGTQDFIVRVRDAILPSRWGVWTFASVDSLEDGHASRYEVALPAQRNRPSAAYTSVIASLYLQDQWQATPTLRITAGIRGDAEYLPAPRRNASLLANDTLGNIDTGDIPSGNLVLSPRVGFAWSLGRNARSMLRGGAGFFTARPPYAWTTGAYAQTGETQATLICTPKEGVPAVTADIDNPPTSCSRDGGRSSSLPVITHFSNDFRQPQSLKAAIGLDTELGRRWTASIDVIAARTKNQLFVTDENLAEGRANSEGRVMYGAIAGSSAQPARESKGYLGIYRLSNYTEDRSISASTGIRKQWSSDKLIDIGYTWTRTMDVMGLLGFNGQVFVRNNPLEGTLTSRKLARSARDIPHNLVATAIFPVAAGFRGGLFFRARSGTPWAFTVGGDANADGASGNDLAYIPRDSSDLSLRNPAAFHALDDLINRLGCVRAQRGRIMERNSCRNRPVMVLDARIAKTLNQRSVRRVELSADVFNVPNLLNRRWGIVRETSDREFIPLMTVVGWDAAHDRPQYSIAIPQGGVPILPSIDRALLDVSRWRIQLGARYEF
jgi:hypothetical protein